MAELLRNTHYIHNNPFRARIVENVSDFIWSSHKGYCSRAKKWDWLSKGFLLSLFSEKITPAMRGYVEFMVVPEPEEIESFYAKKNLPSVLGDEFFKNWIKGNFQDLRLKKEIPAAKELAPGSTTIRGLVIKAFKVEDGTLMISKRGTENLPRDVAIYLQRKYCSQTLTELGKDYGISSYSSVSSAFERVKSRLLTDSKLKRKVSGIVKKLNKGQRQT